MTAHHRIIFLVRMHRVRIFPPLALAVLALLLASTSCTRDDDGPSVNPAIEFVMGEGYTYLDDTVAAGDTLLVGVRINKGDDGLNTFKVLSKYDDGREAVVDSLSIGTETFSFDKTIPLRDLAGTERWTFWVRETDGDVIRRSLTFTVR